MYLILIKYWKQLLLVLTLVTVLYVGYSYIKSIGYLEAETKYSAIITQHEKEVTDKARTIEVMSNVLVEQQKTYSKQLTASIDSIMVKLKGKTLTIVKNGECTPSQTFSDSFQEINKRVNENIK